jgi:hypothetical protein
VTPDEGVALSQQLKCPFYEANYPMYLNKNRIIQIKISNTKKCTILMYNIKYDESF